MQYECHINGHKVVRDRINEFIIRGQEDTDIHVNDLGSGCILGRLSDFGKTIFFSLEEAEAVLKNSPC